MAKILLFILIGFGYATVAEAENYCQATIYYFDWDTRTRARLSIDDVREKYSTKIHIQETTEITQFIESLPLEHMKTVEKPINSSSVDVRLVIDLLQCNGIVDSYYANRFNLNNLDGTKMVHIDEGFRNSFRIRIKWSER
ncbi:MAG: hypothetical protein WBN06_03180 [Lysobacterales bacterium]